jgi:nonribosomal peptide synthetase DhbF
MGENGFSRSAGIDAVAIRAPHAAVADEVLPEAFETQAAANPDAVALVFRDQRLTYRELDTRANRLARYLISRDVGPEVLVALAMERSLEMIVAILGVLKSGGAYVPLDPTAPSERVQYMMRDSGARLLLTTRDFVRRISVNGLDAAVCLDDDDFAGQLATLPPSSPTNEERTAPLRPHNLAYVIYTSGSTGKPKGVGVTQETVVRMFSVTRQWFDFGPDHVWALFMSYAFDVSVWEIWAPLIHGGRLVVLDEDTRRSPGDLLALLARERVTGLCQTPSSFYPVVDFVRTSASPDLSLRHIILVGEALEFRRLAPWHRRYGDTAPMIATMYGPTETTVYVTYMPLNRATTESTTASLIGQGFPDISLFVLDESLSHVPHGESGELYIAGDGLARCYLNRPGLTADRFIACPFGPPGSRMYRTGDLARWTESGDMDFLGRVDQQVKIRGYRIEPGEIEVALVDLPGVGQAAVVPREIAAEVRLVAYLVPRTGVLVPAPSEIRSALALRLPEYMIPSAFVTLPALPLNTSGKLDRAALPAPEVVGEAIHREPSDENERILVDLFKNLTGANRVSIDDSFFDLGGHSLLGVRLLAGIKKSLGKTLPLAALFQGPSVAELARVIADRAAPLDWRSLVPIHLGGREAPIFMIQWLERDLARHLAKDRPVWGLSVGLARKFGGAGPDLPDTVEETAAHYIEEMRSVRPEGPYLLLGHSAGGVVAFEMARQLVAAGQEVSFLGLLDASFPHPRESAGNYPI